MVADGLGGSHLAVGALQPHRLARDDRRHDRLGGGSEQCATGGKQEPRDAERGDAHPTARDRDGERADDQAAVGVGDPEHPPPVPAVHQRARGQREQ
jgi:hypothetical protein